MLDSCRSSNDRPAGKVVTGRTTTTAAATATDPSASSQVPESSQPNATSAAMQAQESAAANKTPEQRRSVNKLVMKLKNSDSFMSRSKIGRATCRERVCKYV